MAYLKWGACAALVVGAAQLCGPVGANVTTEACTAQCLLGINLARTGKLDTRLTALQRDAALEGAAGSSITDNNLVGNAEANCALVANTTPVSEHVVGYMATYNHDVEFNCTQLIQTMITAALAALGNYAEQNWDNGAAAPYNNEAVQNLAYLMFPAATNVGCARTNNCAAGTNLMICRLQPTLSAAFAQPPFSAAFFTALKARADKGILLTNLGEGDLNTPLDKGSGGASGAFAVAPGVISAVALTVTSVLGLVAK